MRNLASQVPDRQWATEFHCSLRPIAASGHTASKAPDLSRTPKRSGQVERDHKTREGLVYLYPDPAWRTRGRVQVDEAMSPCRGRYVVLCGRSRQSFVSLVASGPSVSPPGTVVGRPRKIRLQPPLRPIGASGHTASNAPDLFRTPKLSGAGPG